MIRPKNETEDLLLAITKNCLTPIKQTHTKVQDTLEFMLSKPKETFSFKRSIHLDLDSKWIIGITSPEVHNTIFNITEQI